MERKANQEVVVDVLRPFGTSIFTEMTVLSNRHGAVNLSQGFPDFDGPEEIRTHAAESIMRGPNQYALSYGIPEIRQAIARKVKRFYNADVDPDEEITVTAGATEGLCATLLGILEPGDDVILLDPAYDSYAPISALARANIRYVSLDPPDFHLPKRRLAEAFGSRTRAIVINNPQNPCGKVFSREELEFIGTLCETHDAFMITDEVYEHLVYDGRHITLLDLSSIKGRSFVISSTAKTFSMTGWKIGYVIASPPLSRAVRMSHQFITFCGQSALQEAMAFAMDFPDTYYDQLCHDYLNKRNMLSEALSDMGFNIYPCEGTYYLLVDITSLGFEDDVDFCRMLPEKGGVAAIPCSCFYQNRSAGRNLVRFCFCKKESTLAEAIRRLKGWLK